ncbi:sulfite exporter TauE/SafE family protein [Nocardiopsis sp. NPDC055824]
MIDHVLPLLAFGVLTGLTTVLFGFGGGFVTVPVVYAFAQAQSGPGGDPMHVAVATSTAVMVVNSLGATVAQYRAGRLRREYLWPLVLYVGLGALLGAAGALAVGDTVQRFLFAAYLAVTIVDSVVRKGFLTGPGTEPRGLGPVTTTVGGAGIGAAAGCLGVGGSVLTVPLLRRRGLPMAHATAMANPLSLPVAVVGTAVYALAGGADAAGGASGQVGYVDVVAVAALLAGSLPTIALARRVVGRIPDRVHAVAYVVLLAVALLAVLLV